MELVRGRFGHSTLEQKFLWAPLYERVLNLIGSTGVIIPIGDTNHEASNRTTCTTVGEEQAVFTYSEAVTSFDTPPSVLGPAGVPIITFNGTDEEADSPDAAYWTRALVPMSIAAWVNFSGGDAMASTIISKWGGTQREWGLATNGADKLQLTLVDEDDAVTPDAKIDTLADAAIRSTAWVLVMFRYDGTAEASGIKLYQDGAIVASTDTDDANFLSMRDKNRPAKLGFQGDTPGNLFDGKMAGGPLGPIFTQAELSADAILRLYQLGRAALGE